MPFPEVHVSEDHWDFERAYARDDEREPTRHRTSRQRPQLTSYGTLRRAHEEAQREKLCTVESLPLRPGYTRKMCRASCSSCGFKGREYGPAEVGWAHDEARDHRCPDGAK